MPTKLVQVKSAGPTTIQDKLNSECSGWKLLQALPITRDEAPFEDIPEMEIRRWYLLFAELPGKKHAYLVEKVNLQDPKRSGTLAEFATNLSKEKCKEGFEMIGMLSHVDKFDTKHILLIFAKEEDC